MAKIAELVKGYREKIARDPEFYDGDIDVVLWLVSDTPDRDWTPGQVGRAVGISTHAAGAHLSQLAEEKHIARDQRGSWSHFWSRRGGIR
jgi:hypothetical protein